MQHSTFGPIAVAIYQTLQSYDGVNADQVMQRCGLKVSDFSDPYARLDPAVHQQLVAEAVEATGDVTFGLRFSDFVHPTTFHALGFALLSSSTLRAFCRRWDRYHSFITTTGEVTLEESGPVPRLNFPKGSLTSDVTKTLLEGQISTVLRLIRFMYRPDYYPPKVELMCPPAPGTEAIYAKYLGPCVVMNAERNALYFDPDDLDVPLPAANAELARQNDQVVVQFLAKLKRADVAGQAHAKLIELLPSGECSKAQVASALNMSVRTLHNRLADAGTTYQQLLDNTRRDLAQQYMKQMNVSVSEVAYLLGFSDCSNFSRAFHRWTGQSPSEYREQARDSSVAGVRELKTKQR